MEGSAQRESLQSALTPELDGSVLQSWQPWPRMGPRTLEQPSLKAALESQHRSLALGSSWL